MERVRLSFDLVLWGISGLFAGVAPVIRSWASLIVSPSRFVEDGQTLKWFAGESLVREDDGVDVTQNPSVEQWNKVQIESCFYLQVDDGIGPYAFHWVQFQVPLKVAGVQSGYRQTMSKSSLETRGDQVTEDNATFRTVVQG